MRIATSALLLFLLVGCASGSGASAHPRVVPEHSAGEIARLIPDLSPCNENPDHRLHLMSGRPVFVLVHGSFGSATQLHGLAQALTRHDQQTVCFTYDDRARLTATASRLRRAIDSLSVQLDSAPITVMGHSLGALIAHKSLTDLGVGVLNPQSELRLVTVSGPFAGISAASTCGRRWLYPLSLGLIPLSCYATTGAKWQDINYRSAFIREPGLLVPWVSQFIKIDTDERGTCRGAQITHCGKDHVVFSVAEQRNYTVEHDIRGRRLEVQAGHGEIMGDESIAPAKLLAILQEQGLLPPAPAERLARSVTLNSAPIRGSVVLP